MKTGTTTPWASGWQFSGQEDNTDLKVILFLKEKHEINIMAAKYYGYSKGKIAPQP